MSIEPTSEQNEEPSAFMPVPGGILKWAYGAFILVMPFVAFGATGLFEPTWQDGKFSSYLILLLFEDSSLFFFPLLAFSIFSYIALLINPRRFSQQFTIRLGIYLGVVLALHFSIVSGLFFISDEEYAFLLPLLWIAPLIVPKGYRWAAAKWGSTKVIAVLIVLFLAASILMIAQSSMFAPFMFIMAALTIASPFWCFLIFAQAAIWLFKNAETGITLPGGLGLTAWLGVYAFAWRFAILKMYELYAALPPQPPTDCYIATAAAQGHPQFVGSKVVQHPSGKLMMTNEQLQNLKCAELALMAVHPRLHKRLRRIYNIVGKSLARRIKNPFLADIAYLSLKPWEWMSHWMLRMIVPEVDSISRNFYTHGGHNCAFLKVGKRNCDRGHYIWSHRLYRS